MKRFTVLFFLILAGVLALSLAVQADVSPSITLYYGDVSLTSNGPIDSGNFPQIWDLTAGNITIQATVDLTGESDVAGAHAWSELGVRQVGAGNFNPTWQVEGAGVWLATDYDWTVGTFDLDPAGSPTQDLDDKFILQKAGGIGEGAYNLPSVPPAPGDNHYFWFDRDGVDQWQALSTLAVNGGTYNTNGSYDVIMTLHGTGATTGTAYMTINGLAQGFETNGDWNTMELTPAGMTFTGDMTQLQIFYGLWGYGAEHNVKFKNIQVTGNLVLESGMATGGGWFIPEPDKIDGLTEGGKATFGFVAKQDETKGATGKLEFQYHADNLNLKSTSYEWVNIATTQAIFEGTGTLNGEGEYKFRVRAIDGQAVGGTAPDRFEIRIWTNDGTFDSPTYRAEGNLGGGQIVVNKK